MSLFLEIKLAFCEIQCTKSFHTENMGSTCNLCFWNKEVGSYCSWESLLYIAVASISLYKTMFLSAKCNGKVRVTARKQIIQKPYEHFTKTQWIIVRVISL